MRRTWTIALMLISCVAKTHAIEFNDTVVVDSGVVVVTVPEDEWNFEMPVDSALDDSIRQLNEQNIRSQQQHADTARITLQLDSLVYGGFVGCMYALHWNNTMYRDYSQAYIDIMDTDPNTKSYENFLPPGYDINTNLSRIQKLFQNKKDYYRRYRDLSIFAFIGVYLLSVVDAYVDAELSSFDISRDLSMKVRPTIINRKDGYGITQTPTGNNSYGVQCALTF